MEAKRGTRVYELMETRLQELLAGLNIPTSSLAARESRLEDAEEKLRQREDELQKKEFALRELQQRDDKKAEEDKHRGRRRKRFGEITSGSLRS